MIAFILGLVVGGALGVFVMCLCVASGNAERHEDDIFGEENNHGKGQ